MYKNNATVYFFSYMAIGCFTPLIGIYLKELGFSGAQIGTITAVGTAVAIIAVAFWGKMYSMSDSKALIIEFLCVCAVCASFALSKSSTFIVVITIYGIMYFFQAPIMSLVDSLTALGSGNGNFGSKRAWGAVGFAAGVFVAGRFVGYAGGKVIFVLYAGCFILTLLFLDIMRKKSKKIEEASTGTDEIKGYRHLLRESRVLKLLICMFFMGGTNVANNTYFSFLYVDGGGTVSGVGAAMLLMVGSEVPFMFLSEKLSIKFTMEKTVLIAMMISVVRFALYGAGLPWWMLMALFFTQGAVNGIILVEFVRYIAQIAPNGCRSLAISAYYTIGSNISTIVCQFVGGVILGNLGAPEVYIFFSLFNAAGVVLYIAFGLYRDSGGVKIKKHKKTRKSC